MTRPSPRHRNETPYVGGQLPAAVPPRPVEVEPAEDALVPWERAISLITNIVVVVTCTVILYTIWRGYVALQALGDSLGRLGGAA